LSGLLLAANTLTRLPLERPSAQDSPRLARQAQSAADVWIADPYLAYLSSLHWAWAAQSDPSVVASRLDLAAIERAVALDSRDPFAALERTRVLRTYELGSDEIDAAYDETFRRWPLFPAARLEFAEYLIGLGHLDEARTQLGVVRGLAIDDTGFRETLDRLDRSAAGEAP
jgi:hypothetical protein